MTPFFCIFRIPPSSSQRATKNRHIICVILFCNFFALPRHSFLLSALISLRLIHPKCRNDQERASGVLFSSLLSSTFSELSRQSVDFFCFATLLFAIFSHHYLPLHSFIIMKSLSRATVAAIAILGEFRKAIMVKIRSWRASLVLPIVVD